MFIQVHLNDPFLSALHSLLQGIQLWIHDKVYEGVVDVYLDFEITFESESQLNRNLVTGMTWVGEGNDDRKLKLIICSERLQWV